MLLFELQFGRVLDRDDALRVWNVAREHVQQRRLAGASAARDEQVQPMLELLSAIWEPQPIAAPSASNPWDKFITASTRPWPAEVVPIEPNVKYPRTLMRHFPEP